jgi:L-asparaginase
MKRIFYKNIHYKTVTIATRGGGESRTSLLVIYTGGTLGMVYNEAEKHLVPFDFEQIMEKIPELNEFQFSLTVISFNQLIDSANVTPSHWVALATLIEENYHKYEGFVIIHGTDTMAHSASALSFLLENLNKPVIFTGAQLPIGAVRTDARENLISALEIASKRKDGRPMVTEVCIFFNNKLLRGCRAKKVESAQFGAFESANYPALAECGTRIVFNPMVIKPYQPFSDLKVYKKMDTRVVILRLFPGIDEITIRAILGIDDLQGLVLETYGSGNAPTRSWFIDALKEGIDKGLRVLNVSQCNGGTVIQGRYETSKALSQIGVISGADLSTEAAITKMMFLLANEPDPKALNRKLGQSIRGEMTTL